MGKNLWEFIGIDKEIHTESERLLTQLYGEFFKALSDLSGLVYTDFASVDELTKMGQATPGEYKYFWDWLEEFGLPKLRKIGVYSFPEDDQFLDLLDFRIYALAEDCRNGIGDSVVASLADAIGEVYTYTIACEEVSATRVSRTSFNPVMSCSGILQEIFKDAMSLYLDNGKKDPLENSGSFYYLQVREEIYCGY